MTRGLGQLCGQCPAAGRKMAQDPAESGSLTGAWYPDIIPGDQRMLRCLHNMSPVTMALITWSQWARHYSAQLGPCRALRSPQNIMIRLQRLLQSESNKKMATHFPVLDGAWRMEESGQNWPCPRSESGYLIFSTWDKLGRGLSSIAGPAQAKVRPLGRTKWDPFYWWDLDGPAYH